MILWNFLLVSKADQVRKSPISSWESDSCSAGCPEILWSTSCQTPGSSPPKKKEIHRIPLSHVEKTLSTPAANAFSFGHKNADQLIARTWWHPAAYVPKMAFHQKLCKFGLRRAIDLWGAFTSAPTHVGIDHFSLTIWFAHLGTNWTGRSLVMWTSQFWSSKKVLAVRTVLSTDTRRILQKMRKQLASGIYLHFPRLYIIVTCHTVWYYTIAYSLICCYVLLYRYTVVYIAWYL